MEFALKSGSRAKANAALYDPLYQQLLTLYGAGATIFPLVDPHHRTAATTSLIRDGASGSSSGLGTDIVTATEAPEAFDTPFDPQTSFQGIIPYVTLNEVDEGFITPDLGYFSRNDGGGEALSVGGWVNLKGRASGASVVMSKYDAGEAIQEWWWGINSSEKPAILLRDDNVSIEVNRIANAAIGMDVWHQVVITYDGAGGAAAMNSVIIYMDGAVLASTATNNGSYVAMEPGTSNVAVGGNLNTSPTLSSALVGKLACGPLGPWFSTAEVSAANIAESYRIGRAALEL